MIEATIVVPLLLFCVILGVDLITLARYSSAMHWLAITAARVSSVETPDDGSVTAPTSTQLKLPQLAAQPAYLPSYIQANTGCKTLPLNEQRLRVLNLALGEAQRVLSKKAKTASTWIIPADVDAQTMPLAGEMIVVPVQCDENPEPGKVTDWKACMNIPLMLLGSKYVCFTAGSSYWDI